MSTGRCGKEVQEPGGGRRREEGPGAERRAFRPGLSARRGAAPAPHFGLLRTPLCSGSVPEEAPLPGRPWWLRKRPGPGPGEGAAVRPPGSSIGRGPDPGSRPSSAGGFGTPLGHARGRGAGRRLPAAPLPPGAQPGLISSLPPGRGSPRRGGACANQSQAGNASRGPGGCGSDGPARILAGLPHSPPPGPPPESWKLGGRPTPALRSTFSPLGRAGRGTPVRLRDQHRHPRLDAPSRLLGRPRRTRDTHSVPSALAAGVTPVTAPSP